MPVVVGTLLGPYEVLAPLGAGGMGEVYRARDMRLDRTVAIKVLPPELASDPQFRERFDREARVISQLDHPHICTLYDVGEQGDTSFLVMQFVDGESLDERLKDGALPLDQALAYAIQIGGALDAAHRAGIVHRDLKPGNVMIAKTGAKLLDFGLAKSGVAILGGGTSSRLPTTPPALTGQGTLLGTFQYMAPEQLEGAEADSRTDIFAFGAVVYEMLTGKRAFEGKSHASLIGAILKDTPLPISTTQPLATAALDRAVGKCLAKDPDARWQSAGDLVDELRWIREQPVSAADSTAVARPRRMKLTLVASGIAIAISAAVLTWAAMRPRQLPSRPLTRFAITLPASEQFTGLDRQFLAISPDGTHVVYVANNRLYLRAMDELESVPIRGTDGGTTSLSPVSPFFSPEGRSIGFWQGGQLKTVSITGGTPVTLCSSARITGASWLADEAIVFAAGALGIQRVSSSGGIPEVLVKMGPGQGALNPQLVSHGREVLFTLRRNVSDPTTDQIVVQPLDRGERRVLVEHGSVARYVSSGHLVYLEVERTGSSGLVATPVDPSTLAVHGDPVSVVEDVRRSTTTASAQYSISESGTLVFAPSQRELMTLTWVDRLGHEAALPPEPRPYAYERISPDGKRLAVTLISPDQDQAIWLWDFDRANLTKLTFTPSAVSPVWTPDGRSVVFTSRGGGIDRQDASGAGGVEHLVPLQQGPIVLPDAFTPDGTALVVRQRETKSGWDLSLVSMNSEHLSKPLLKTPSNERLADISPDGRFIAYQSDESGPDEVYVRPFPRVDDGKWQISRGGGYTPKWARDGRELFYLTPDGRMMSVGVQTQPSFSYGAPMKLFEGSYASPSEARHFDVAADGRFLMLKPAGSGDSPRLIVVENWTEELKRRVPTK